MTAADRRRARLGLIYAIGAYGLWGLIPLYFKAVKHVSPPEVLAYRAAWSFVVLAAILGFTGGWGELRRSLSPKTVVFLGASTLLIAINWLTFIYAVSTSQVVESSLGYFVNPLANVLLGVVLLGERLRKFQWASIALAAFGMLVLARVVGTFPWLALVLAMSFSLYGLLKKTIPIGSLVGLTVETLVLAPFALAYLAYLHETGAATANGAATQAALALSGVVTSVPLLLFAVAARRLRLSTLGFVQYLSPTGQFLLAVFAFGEAFSTGQLVSFACIWAAVVVFVIDSLRVSRQPRLEIVEPD